MDYISGKRFRGLSVDDKPLNIPALSQCTGYKGLIAWNGNIVCAIHSECCENYFAYNEDGNGLKRFNLIRDIKKILEKNKQRWKIIWSDTKYYKYRRTDQPDDIWLWNDNFYQASIEDLQKLYNSLQEDC